MKTILLTNDDGYLSPGLQHLQKALADAFDWDIYTVAPDRERSAISMALTINDPLRLNQVGEKAFTVDGTPTDCVNIGLQRVLPKRPDFIVSGMNLGENLCEDVLFSGTVAAAFAGCMYGIPSLAVSMVGHKSLQENKYNFQEAATIAAQTMQKLVPITKDATIYNLNIPNPTNGKTIVTKLGEKRYQPSIIDGADPRGRKFYWIGTGFPTVKGEEGSDLWAVENGDVSLSILKYDLNDYEKMKKLSEAIDEKRKN